MASPPKPSPIAIAAVIAIAVAVVVVVTGREGADAPPDAASPAPASEAKSPRGAAGAGSIAGKVVRAGGGPLEGARVEVLAEGEQSAVRGARSGSDGSFSIAGLAAGSYRVRATAAGARDATLGPIRVREGEEYALDIELAAQVQESAAPAGTLRGQVVDAQSGEPVRSFSVGVETMRDAEGGFTISRAAQRRGAWIAAGGYAPARVPEDGRVALDRGLRVRMRAVMPGGEPVQGRGAAQATVLGMPRAYTDTYTDATGAFTVNAVPIGATVDVLVVVRGMQALATLGPFDAAPAEEVVVELGKGRHVKGVLLRGDGQSVEGVAVTVRGPKGLLGSTSAGAGGSFVVGPIEAGRHLLMANYDAAPTEGPRRIYSRRIVVRQGALDVGTVSMPSGSASVSARVELGDAEGAVATLVPGGLDRGRLDAVEHIQEDAADGTSWFLALSGPELRFDDVPPGAYTLAVFAYPGDRASRRLALAGVDVRDVPVRVAEPLRLDPW